jgi:hypothetical protein
MAEIAKTKRVLVTLDNNQALYIYNMDLEASFDTPIVLSGKPVPTAQADSSLVYKLNHSASGWFGSIKADDDARLSNLMQLADETILLKVSPLKSYDIKDLAKAKPFVAGGAQ